MSLILLVLVVEEAGIIVLLHELLGRLVDIHVGHLLRCLSCLFISCCFLLLCLPLFCLDFLELLEHILVMEQSMGEFVHKGGACEESFDAALEDGNLEQLVDRGPLSRVSLQHHGNNVRDSR